MKYLYFLIVFILLFSSCTVYQDFHFNKDGSGHLDVLLDASSLIQLSQMYSLRPDTVKKDKYEDMILKSLDKIYLDLKIEMVDIIPDSIKQKIDNIDELRGVSIVFFNNKSDSKVGLRYVFESIENLDRKLDRFHEISKFFDNPDSTGSRKLAMLYGNVNDYNKTSYSKQIKFKKGKVIILPVVDNKNKMEDEEPDFDSQQMMNSMVSVQTRIFLPGKVKKSKSKDYQIIDDNVVVLNDGKVGVINSKDKEIKIKYKRAWWDIF